MCPASIQISLDIGRNVTHNQEEIPSIETDIEVTRGDGISRELPYGTLKTAIINMFTDLKEYMTTIVKNETT